VARRIEELQARNEKKAEKAAMTRDELIEILTEIVHATVLAYRRLATLMVSKQLRC
jgi:hypothetical protein